MKYILGPCTVLKEKDYFDNLEAILTVLEKNNISLENFYYKCSYLKANRSSNKGNIGPGMAKAIKWFEKTRINYQGKVQLTTDVHEVGEVAELQGLLEICQIPAMLSRQTFLINEAASYFDIVNIKKGQMLSPWNMNQGIDKIKDKNPNCQAWLTERGTAFGYTGLIVDFNYIKEFKDIWDCVIHDITHSVQRMKPDGFTTGNKDLAERFFLTSSIFGYEGIFAEVSLNPDESPSDKDSIIHIDRLKELFPKHLEIENALKST